MDDQNNQKDPSFPPWVVKNSLLQTKQEPGLKYDAGKPRWDLWDLKFLEDVHAVLVFGEKKYGAWNWAKGMSYSRCFNAFLRHVWAWWWDGEEDDPESGLSHLAHATCMVMFIHGMRRRRAGTDDRPSITTLYKGDPVGELQRGKGHAPK